MYSKLFGTDGTNLNKVLMLRLPRVRSSQGIRRRARKRKALQLQDHRRRGGEYHPVLLAEVEGKNIVPTTAFVPGGQDAKTQLLLSTGKYFKIRHANTRPITICKRCGWNEQFITG